jgi:hypothetical protein
MTYLLRSLGEIRVRVQKVHAIEHLLNIFFQNGQNKHLEKIYKRCAKFTVLSF